MYETVRQRSCVPESDAVTCETSTGAHGLTNHSLQSDFISFTDIKLAVKSLENENKHCGYVCIIMIGILGHLQ